jgi:hypothetical protein
VSQARGLIALKRKGTDTGREQEDNRINTVDKGERKIHYQTFFFGSE